MTFLLPSSNAGERAHGEIADLAEARARGGQVRLSLRQPWRDGTTDFVFDPVEFVGRLAVLVPRPRINLLLYYEVLGAKGLEK